jgi:hypothetical protein
MRPLGTGADRAMVSALVQDRNDWLAARGHDAAAGTLSAFHDAPGEALGLFEYDAAEVETMVGCLNLYGQPDLQHWKLDDPTPGPMVSHLHTAPGRDDRPGWLLTMWLSDHAARLGATWVYAQAPGRRIRGGDTEHRLLDHLRRLGWQTLGSSWTNGRGTTRLRLNAQSRPGLAALIHCAVPFPGPRS